MPFQPKTEVQRNDAKILVSMPRQLRREAEEVARDRGISLSEVGRRALRQFFEIEGHNGSAQEETG